MKPNVKATHNVFVRLNEHGVSGVDLRASIMRAVQHFVLVAKLPFGDYRFEVERILKDPQLRDMSATTGIQLEPLNIVSFRLNIQLSREHHHTVRGRLEIPIQAVHQGLGAELVAAAERVGKHEDWLATPVPRPKETPANPPPPGMSGRNLAVLAMMRARFGPDYQMPDRSAPAPAPSPPPAVVPLPRAKVEVMDVPAAEPVPRPVEALVVPEAESPAPVITTPAVEPAPPAPQEVAPPGTTSTKSATEADELLALLCRIEEAHKEVVGLLEADRLVLRSNKRDALRKVLKAFGHKQAKLQKQVDKANAELALATAKRLEREQCISFRDQLGK